MDTVFGMTNDERKLFERTREYVARTCPNLPENERIHVVAKVYKQMRFTLKLPNVETGQAC